MRMETSMGKQAVTIDTATPRTFTFDCAKHGALYGEDFIAVSRDQAEAMAVASINANWRETYTSWEDMVAGMDGCGLTEHPAVMAERLPLATVTLYRRLADGLSDMVEERRLSEADIPDDYAWLTKQLEAIAGADPGEADPPAHMCALNGHPRSDEVIVKQANGLAQRILREVHGYDFRDTFAVYSAADPRARKAWAAAVIAFEELQATPVTEALDNWMDDEEPATSSSGNPSVAYFPDRTKVIAACASTGEPSQ